MFISLVTKITLMAREGSLCLHIQNSGEGLIHIILFQLITANILVSIYSYCEFHTQVQKHGFQNPSSL